MQRVLMLTRGSLLSAQTLTRVEVMTMTTLTSFLRHSLQLTHSTFSSLLQATRVSGPLHLETRVPGLYEPLFPLCKGVISFSPSHLFCVWILSLVI